MVHFSDIKPLGKTKKRLNQSNMELGGILKKSSIFSRFKRRFSQSERDLTSLSANESLREPNSSFDDSFMDCTMVTKITNKSQSYGELCDVKAVDTYRFGTLCSSEYFYKNKGKNLPEELFNHKSTTQRKDSLNGFQNDQLVNRTQPNREKVCNHYVDSRKILMALKATRINSSPTKMASVDDCEFVDENRNKTSEIEIQGKLTDSELTGTGNRDMKCSAERDDEVGVRKKGCKERFLGRTSACFAESEKPTDLERKTSITNTESETAISLESTPNGVALKEEWTKADICTSIETLAIIDTQRKNIDCLNESKHQICNEVFEKAERNSENIDKKIGNVYYETCTPQNTKEKGAITKSNVFDEEKSPVIMKTAKKLAITDFPARNVNSKSAENLLAKNYSDFDDSNIFRKQTREVRLRRLSAPSVLQIEPEEQARLEKMFKNANKERSNSLKSALKRRSLSDTTGSSLRVRFDLTKNNSSERLDSSALNEEYQDDGRAEIKQTSAPKKRWNYVMRKFRIKQPLMDFSAYNESTEKATASGHSKEAEHKQKNAPVKLISSQTASELDARQPTEKEQPRNGHTEDDPAVEIESLNRKPSDASWSDLRPGNEDGSAIPLLHIAAADGDKELLKTLISIGVDLDERDSNGWPAIHYAIVRGHFACAALLLESGVNLNYYTNSVVDEYCKTVRTVMIKKDT